MPKRSSKKQKPRHVDALAGAIVHEGTRSDEVIGGKNPHAVALGRLGGKKGGPARAKKLTMEQRRDIARKAARARWHGGT
jgi:hypothetical protein